MIRINLLPVRAIKKKRLIERQLYRIGSSFIFLFLLIGAVHYYQMNTVKALKMEIEKKEKELSVLKTKTGELTKVRDENKLIRQRLNIVKDLESNRTGPVRLFEDISRAIPEKAWLIKLVDNENQILLTGSAESDDDISTFMKNLEKLKDIKKVELEVLELALKDNYKSKSFSIKMDRLKHGT